MGVESVRVPRELALETHARLRQIGRRNSEGLVLWAGVTQGKVFFVTHLRVPEQIGIRTHDGVLVAVGAEELHRLNVWLYEEGLTLVAQIHSHPTDAYHSQTDDALPIVTTIGGLSLVVPFFARNPFSLDEYAVYRLTPDVAWSGLSADEVSKLIVVED